MAYSVHCYNCRQLRQIVIVAINDDESMIGACAECDEEMELYVSEEGVFIGEPDDELDQYFEDLEED